MKTTRRRSGRAGRTAKVSISLDRSDLSMLRKRARRLYGGNLSAVIAEGVRRIQEEAGREALVRWLGEAGQTTPEQREAIRAEWRGEAVRRRRRRIA
jgi:Arc/MetJ-type ribon-helix-helix transcriptional regulator